MVAVARPYTRLRNEDFLDRLACLLSSGMSHSKAAAALGLTSRNVTIGAAHRARTAGDSRFGADASQVAVVARRAARAPKPKSQPRRPALRVIDPALADLPMFNRRAAYLAWAPVADQMSIVDVGTRQCRYIAGEREVIRLVGELAERHGGQGQLARALGLNESQVSRAVTGVSVQIKLADALGLVFDGARGRYVRVRDPAYADGTIDPIGALTEELADTKLSLKGAKIRIAMLVAEVERLKSKLAGHDQVAA